MSSTKDQNQDGCSKHLRLEQGEREENEKRRYLMELNSRFFVEGSTQQPALVFEVDEEIPARLSDLCRTMAERYTSRPAFRQASFESLLEFLGSECGHLLTDHPADFTVVTGEATSGTRHALRFTVLYNDLSCELAASAFDRFVLGRHVQAPVAT